MSQTDYARYRLMEWGLWGRDKGIGWYTHCPYLVERSSSLHEPGYVPPHIEQIDKIVVKIDVLPIRQTIVWNYAKTGTSKREKARLMGVSWETYRDRLDRGEWFVKTELDAAPNL